MNAILLLKQQHRALQELCRRHLDGEKSPPAVREGFLRTLSNDLLTHTTVEERHFYRAVTSSSTEAELRDCLAEHRELRRKLAALMHHGAGATDVLARARELQRALDEHIDNEERNLFELVERILDRQTLDALGSIMELAVEQLRRDSGPEGIPNAPSYPGGFG